MELLSQAVSQQVEEFVRGIYDCRYVCRLESDPARSSVDLRSKLDANRRIGTSRLDKVTVTVKELFILQSGEML